MLVLQRGKKPPRVTVFHKKESVAAWGCHPSAVDIHTMASICTLQTLPMEHPAQMLPSAMCESPAA